MGFLDRVTVIDATRLLPGGFCTMLLSDLGAKVIKVEEPGIGDYLRVAPPTVNGRSPLHSNVNRNKLSIGVNLRSSEGKEVMRRLLRRADVFLEGFRPGVMDRLGFSFKAVKRVNPDIVYCSITAYGQASTLSSVPGHDINFQATAGTLAYSSPAVVPQLQLADQTAGMYAALGILAALVGRKGGVHLDIPIVPSLVSFMVVPASAYLATGRSPARGDSLLFGTTPSFNLFATRAGKHVAVGALEEGFWRSLLKQLGVPDMEHMRFGSQEERHRVAAALARIFMTKTRDEWAGLLVRQETCASPVLTIGEAIAGDWGDGLSLLSDVGGEKILGGPVRSTPPARGRAMTKAPSLGKDTGSLMRGLGYSVSRVRALRRKGAIQ